MAGVAKLYSPAVVNVTPYNKLIISVPADMDQLVKGSLYTGRHCLVHHGGVHHKCAGGRWQAHIGRGTAMLYIFLFSLIEKYVGTFSYQKKENFKYWSKSLNWSIKKMIKSKDESCISKN